MKNKIDIVSLITQFLNVVNTQFHVQVQAIRTYNALGLVEGDMKQLFF